MAKLPSAKELLHKLINEDNSWEGDLELIRADRRAVLEAAAEVAEEFSHGTSSREAAIAAAIRALKEDL